MHGMIVIAVLVSAFSLAATATAQVPVGHRQQANFSPCLWTQDGPPPINTCNDTAPKVVATCNPTGISTISITRTGNGANFLQGTFTETVTATIGPQTGPPQPEIQVLPSGVRNGSVGFPTGRLLSFNSTFTFQSYDTHTTITGTKSLVDDLHNVGVCREYVNARTDSPYLGGQLTGFFYLANAQVLKYAGTMTTNGVAQAVAGPAETYLANSFATSSGGTIVRASAGHLATSFGTAHPALGSTWWTGTPIGANRTVTPAPGVTLTFYDVSAPGDTTVEVVGTGDVPPLPSDGSFLVGNPPALYEISTAATFTPPVQICVPYGGPAPLGYIPTLLHYEVGMWTDVATTYDELSRIVCGEVTSFSPFAAGYRPADPTVTVPGSLQAEATSPSGAVVTFDANAVDAAQGTLPVTCTPASGSTFALGNTLVACSATDAMGYTTTESFTVSVQPATATLTNTSAASATFGGSLAVSATVAPAFATGTVTFTLGTQAVSAPVINGIASATISPVQGVAGLSTLVISYAGDAAVRPATTSAQVTVVTDTTGPVFGPLTNLVVEATSASGATVIFDLPTAVDGVDGAVAVTCTAASGATFPQGTTPVTCSATDASGNTTAASFTVTVRPFGDPKYLAVRRLLDLLKQYGAPRSLQSVVENLLRHLQASHAAGACGNANAIAKQLANSAKGSRLTSAQLLRLQFTLRAVNTTLGCR